MTIFIGTFSAKNIPALKYEWDTLEYVPTYNDLPDIESVKPSIPYFVENSTGVFPFNRKKGVYIASNGKWLRISDDYLTAYNSARLGGREPSYYVSSDSISLSGVINKKFGKLPIGTSVEGKNLTEVFTEAFVGNVPSSAKLSSNLPTYLFEKGDDTGSFTITIKVKAGNSSPTRLRLLKDTNVINTYNSPTGTLSQDIDNVNKDTVFKALLDDANYTNISSNKINIKFVYPYYTGVGGTGITDPTGLTKHLNWSNTFTLTFTTDNNVMYLCTPVDYPVITSILDENNFETVDDWITRIEAFQCKDGTYQDYRIYEFKNKTTTTATYSFKV